VDNDAHDLCHFTVASHLNLRYTRLYSEQAQIQVIPMFLKYARLVYFGLFFWLPSRYISRFLFFYLQMKFGRPVDDLAKQNILRAAARRRGLYIQGDDAQAVSDYPGHLDSLEGSWHAFLDLLLGESKWAIYSVVSFLFISYGVSRTTVN